MDAHAVHEILQAESDFWAEQCDAPQGIAESWGVSSEVAKRICHLVAVSVGGAMANVGAAVFLGKALPHQQAIIDKKCKQQRDE